MEYAVLISDSLRNEVSRLLEQGDKPRLQRLLEVAMEDDLHRWSQMRIGSPALTIAVGLLEIFRSDYRWNFHIGPMFTHALRGYGANGRFEVNFAAHEVPAVTSGLLTDIEETVRLFHDPDRVARGIRL